MSWIMVRRQVTQVKLIGKSLFTFTCYDMKLCRIQAGAQSYTCFINADVSQWATCRYLR